MIDPVEQFLNRLHHPVLAGIDLSLGRMERLLATLGSPHRRLPPVVHVAGTNGKGSLIAYLHAILTAAGYRVHRYTSPHLVRFHERIVLQGQPIDERYMMSILQHIAPVLQSQPATFFEATTAAAFLAFAEKPADVLLLETGMGGRLDATNVVERPVLTAITPISFDHEEFLGASLTAIAAEKAGIVKKHVPCVIGKQPQEAADVLAQTAQALAAPLYRYGQEWQVVWEGNAARYRSPQRTVSLKPALAGRHQYDNAATAVACIDQLPQFQVSDAQIERGLQQAQWPARLQELTYGAYRRALPQVFELWLDGGHNPQGGEVLAQWLKERGKETYLICGMMQGKDSTLFFRPLAPYVTAACGIGIPGESKSKRPEQVQAAAQSAGIEAFSCESLENALQMIAARAKNPAIICICGSLYLAGKVLAANQ